MLLSGEKSPVRDNKGRRESLEYQQSMSAALQDDQDSGECSGGAPTAQTGGCKSSNLRFGYFSMMGRRRVMEDAVSVAPPVKVGGAYAFFAVYDGHGGSRTAEICSESLHKCLDKHVKKQKKSLDQKCLDWEKVMVKCFRRMDRVVGKDNRRDSAVMMGGCLTVPGLTVGSTALVVLVGAEEIVVANCGDSRAVLYSGGVAVPLSSDHKLDRPDEKQRVEAAMGNIVNFNGWLAEGVLSTSRCLGSHHLKPYVTPDPEVTVYKRNETDDFLIVATDGLFDVVSNQIACQVVKRCLHEQTMRHFEGENGASVAASMLAELAIAKGSKDNISIIVIQLN